MTWQPSWFVPLASHGVQLALALVGSGLLVMTRATDRRWLLVGSAYPVGATIIGLLQWAAFDLGRAWVALPVAGGLALLGAIATIRRFPVFAGRPSPWLATTVSGAAILGFLITESGPLSESDPRFQIGYRAKIIASCDGFADGSYWSDPSTLHINPRYPLLLSCIEGLTVRVAGGSPLTSECRAVGFAFFLSFLWLLGGCSFEVAGPRRGLLPVLAALCVPRLWSTGLDEGYADLPLGVLLLTALVWALREPNWFVIAICGSGVVGLKSEGQVALLVVAAAVVATRPRGGWTLGAAMLGGGAISWLLFRVELRQIDPQMPMENVQIEEIGSAALRAGVSRWPAVLARFATMLGDRTSFGLFFPLGIIASLLAGPRERILLLAVVAYLAALTVPFLVTQLPLDYHLNSTIPRFGFQVLPLLCLGIAGFAGGPQTRSDEIERGQG